MRFLLDTHVLLWAAGEPNKLSRPARRLLGDPENLLIFSAVSLWEVAIKRALGRADFQLDPRPLREGLLLNGYTELAVTGAHAIAADALPPIHKDLFDRMLVAQANYERITLVTTDEKVAKYPGIIRKI